MPKGQNAIVYGKIQVVGDTTLEKLETTLAKILKEHGYPEERKDEKKRPAPGDPDLSTKEGQDSFIETLP